MIKLKLVVTPPIKIRFCYLKLPRFCSYAAIKGPLSISRYFVEF